MKSYPKNAILKLNADYSILSIIDIKSVISLFLRDCINIVATDDSSQIIHPSIGIKRPRAVALKKYVHIPIKTIRASRANLWIRDNGICQYCGKAITLKEMTKDHIIPISNPKCPGSTWINLVSACSKCNHKKGNKSLSQCGMSLIRKPFKPRHEDLIFFDKEIKNIFDNLSKKFV